MIRLLVCDACGTAQYPSRDLCRACLSDALGLRDDDGCGTLLARARLHRSLEPVFGPLLPLDIGMIWLNAGVRVMVVLDGDIAPGDRVVLSPWTSPTGQSAFRAQPGQKP